MVEPQPETKGTTWKHPPLRSSRDAPGAWPGIPFVGTPGERWLMNFHKLATCYSYLTARRAPVARLRQGGRTSPGLPQGQGTPLTRGPGLAEARPPRAGAEKHGPAPGSREGRGGEERRFSKTRPPLTQPPRRVPFSLEHVRGQRPPRPRCPRAQRRPAPHPGRLARAEAAAWRCPFKKGGGGRQRAREDSSQKRTRVRRGLESEESAAAARAASASASRAPARREQNKPQARRQRRPKPTGRLTRRRETSVRQHGAVSDRGAPRLARGAAARPHRGARLRAGAPGSAATARRKGEADAAATTAGLGRPGHALGGREWGRPGGRKGSERNGGESFIFRLEKWREPRPFFKLGLGRGGSCATSAARLAPPPLRAR